MAGDLNRAIKIFLDSSQAQQSAAKYEDSIAKVEAKMLAMAEAGKSASVEYSNLSKNLERQRAGYEKYKQAVADTERVIHNLSGATKNELDALYKEVAKDLRTMSRNTDEYKDKLKLLHAVDRERINAMQEMRGEVGRHGTAFSRLADGFNKYAALGASVVATVTGITMAFKALKDERDKQEESAANLKALTGLDDKDIERMKGFANTLATTTQQGGVIIRQSVTEILDAYTKVGSAKPELLGDADALNEVTKQTMILATAAKMELQPAVDGVTLALNMYGDGADQAARYVNVLAAGSKAGAAEVPSITEAVRKSGVAAAQANVPIEQLVGSIETLAEKGIKDEIAGTGLKTFLLKLETGAKDTRPSIVGLQTALENLRNKNLSSTAMKDLFGLETYNVAQVMINSAKQVKYYTEAVTDTNVAMEQAAINSTTTTAKLAQAKNQMTQAGVALVEKMNPALTHGVNLTTKFVKVLPELVDWVSKYAWIAGILVPAVLSYVAATKLLVLWTNRHNETTAINIALSKAKIIWDKALTAGTALQAAAIFALNGNFVKAGQNVKAFFSIIGLNPWAIAIAGTIAIIAAIATFSGKLSDATLKMNALLDVEKEAAKSTAKQKLELEQLVAIANSNNSTIDERLKAIKRINEISPEYLGNITLENINKQESVKAINEYISALDREAFAKASLDKASEIRVKQIENELKIKKMMTERSNGIRSEELDRINNQSILKIRKENEELEKQVEFLKDISREKQTVLEIYDPSSVGKGPKKKKGNDPLTDPEADKKALKDKSDTIDLWMTNERIKAKLADDGTAFAKQKLNDRLEEIELEGLRKRLAIRGLEPKQIAEIEEKIVDARKKMLAEIKKIDKLAVKNTGSSLNEVSEKTDAKLKDIVKTNNDNRDDQYKKQLEHQEKIIGIATDLGVATGDIIGNFISGNENAMKSSMGVIINMALDALQAQVMISLGLAKVGSLATPQSILTGGAAGLTQAALLTGLITAAFTGVKAIVSNILSSSFDQSSVSDTPTIQAGTRTVTQRAQGKYDVIGNEDGFLYRGVQYGGDVPTGVVSRPTLYGERGAELAVSAPDFRRLQRHINYPMVVQAINDVRSGSVPQRAQGKYDGVDKMNYPASTAKLEALMARTMLLMESLEKNGVRGKVLLSDYEDQQARKQRNTDLRQGKG